MLNTNPGLDSVQEKMVRLTGGPINGVDCTILITYYSEISISEHFGTQLLVHCIEVFTKERFILIRFSSCS